MGTGTIDATSFRNLSSWFSWLNVRGNFAFPGVEREIFEALMFSFDICENDVSLFKFVHEHTHLSSISLEIDDWMSLFESMENETLLPSTSRRLLGDFFTKASKKQYIIIKER